MRRLSDAYNGLFSFEEIVDGVDRKLFFQITQPKHIYDTIPYDRRV